MADNLRPDAALRHGVWPLVNRGELSSEFAGLQPLYDEIESDAIAWVGGTAASRFDVDDARAYARWTVAGELLWRTLAREGLTAKSRRGKSLLQQLERCDTRAAYYRKELRARRFEKLARPDFSTMTVDQYAGWEDQQKALAAAGEERTCQTGAEREQDANHG